MNNKKVTDILYSDIKYKKELDLFSHNLPEDFALFAIWKNARPFLNQIRNLLAEKFEILLETEIIWTEENFQNNAFRLYEVPITSVDNKDTIETGLIRKIGEPNFVLFIIKDKTPQYSYELTASKEVKLANLNTLEAKYKIREWVKEKTGDKFGVHSTNSIQEFYFQAPLIIGVELFEKILNSEKQDIKKINKDLEGANGWTNWTEIFNILNLTTNYLVLRGFEDLPKQNNEKDLDVLTENYQAFASALGVVQTIASPFRGKIYVNGKRYLIDIRYIGDKYYDPSWAKELLNTKVHKNGFFIPRDDHYFFSLLFHAKVQKPKVKEIYKPILKEIAEKLKFDWYTTELLNDNKYIGELLGGYYKTYGYVYEDPIDKWVYRNKEIIKYLPQFNKPTLREQLKELLPESTILLYRKVKRLIGR